MQTSTVKKTKPSKSTSAPLAHDTPITIKGAHMHNLKHIDVSIPRNALVVITGLSGSGKSSLAFDTLYAEGQRRYVESLSAYARQFLGKLEKPKVDAITGLSPAIAIEQKVISHNPRSTVGTVTEIYDYLKLLYARIGKTYSPLSGNLVKRHTVEDVMHFVSTHTPGQTFYIASSLQLPEGRDLEKHLSILSQQGFVRLLFFSSPDKTSMEMLRIEEVLEEKTHPIFSPKKNKTEGQLFLLIDRYRYEGPQEETDNRLADSIQTAFYEGNGECVLFFEEKEQIHRVPFSSRFEADGMVFQEPDVNFFSFNNPIGACQRCEGFGSILGINPDLVIPNKHLSLYEGAIACWSGESMGKYKKEFIQKAHKYNFPVHSPINELTKAQADQLWNGNAELTGIYPFFNILEKEAYKIQYRVLISRYRGKTACPDCRGTRIRKDSENVRLLSKSISDLVLMPVEELYRFFLNLPLSEHDAKIAKRLLMEIKNRLRYLCDVGLGYLTLNRMSNTLSGGESQRIHLATSLGSSLVGSMYILDEPSIGLHPRDTQRLIQVLQSLKDLGNTVIVVEHDEDIMRAADFIIDIGPEAGRLGGEVVFTGGFKDLSKAKKSLTAAYLQGKMSIPIPPRRKQFQKFIELHHVQVNNLKNVSVKFPLHCFCTVIGISGSGKSTLIKTVLHPLLEKLLNGDIKAQEVSDQISGDFKHISHLELVDQNPIGKSSRSNPVTYLKIYDEIRSLMSSQTLAAVRNYGPNYFSFNVDGGRCETCQGEGIIRIEMQFMADVELCCDECKGSRFKSEILEIKYRDKNISDLLHLTVDDAIQFFSEDKKDRTAQKIATKLGPLQQVGLGYIQLGQSSSTLSGGEAQRVKLAYFLSQGNQSNNTLFLFDEPTTGLHFHDIQKLLTSFQLLIEKGNSIIVIEHNPEVIKCADWIIELGPEGGEKGGHLVFSGPPEKMLECKASPTLPFIQSKLRQHGA